MFYAGRQAQRFARGPWFVAGAGVLVLLTGFAAVHRHGGHRHWRDGTSLSSAPNGPATAAKSASSAPTVKSRTRIAPAVRQAAAPAKPAHAASAAVAPPA